MFKRKVMEDLALSDPSLRTAFWVLREVRSSVRKHAVETLAKSRGSSQAEELATKLDSVSPRCSLPPFKSNCS